MTERWLCLECGHTSKTVRGDVSHARKHEGSTRVRLVFPVDDRQFRQIAQDMARKELHGAEA